MSLAERNIAIYSHYTKIVFSIALALSALSFVFVPFAIVFILSVIIFAKSISAKAVPVDIQSQIKSIEPLSGLKNIRSSKASDPSMNRIPGFSLLLLPEGLWHHIKSDTVQAKLHHEAGHLRQLDFMVVSLLICFIVFWALVFVYNMPAMVSGDFTPYADHEFSDLLHKTGMFWLAIFALVSLIALGSLRSILHQREYLADAWGEHTSQGLVGQFLSKQARIERYRRAKSSLIRFSNTITHPSWERRDQHLKNGAPLSSIGMVLGGYAFGFTLFLCLLILSLPSSTQWPLVQSLSQVCVLFLFWFLYGWGIRKLVLSDTFLARHILVHIVGVACGALSASSLVEGVETLSGISASDALPAGVVFAIAIALAGGVFWGSASLYRLVRLKNQLWWLECFIVMAIAMVSYARSQISTQSPLPPANSHAMSSDWLHFAILSSVMIIGTFGAIAVVNLCIAGFFAIVNRFRQLQS